MKLIQIAIQKIDESLMGIDDKIPFIPRSAEWPRPSTAIKAICQTEQIGGAEDVAINHLSGPRIGVAGDLGDEMQRDTFPIELGKTVVPERVGSELGNAGPAGQSLA